MRRTHHAAMLQDSEQEARAANHQARRWRDPRWRPPSNKPTCEGDRQSSMEGHIKPHLRAFHHRPKVLRLRRHEPDRGANRWAMHQELEFLESREAPILWQCGDVLYVRGWACVCVCTYLGTTAVPGGSTSAGSCMYSIPILMIGSDMSHPEERMWETRRRSLIAHAILTMCYTRVVGRYTVYQSFVLFSVGCSRHQERGAASASIPLVAASSLVGLWWWMWRE